QELGGICPPHSAVACVNKRRPAVRQRNPGISKFSRLVVRLVLHGLLWRPNDNLVAADGHGSPKAGVMASERRHERPRLPVAPTALVDERIPRGEGEAGRGTDHQSVPIGGKVCPKVWVESANKEGLGISPVEPFIHVDINGPRGSRKETPYLRRDKQRPRI